MSLIEHPPGGTDGSGDRELGFAGMLAVGMDPQEAYDLIRQESNHPGVRAIIAELRESEQGRAALEYSRQRWAEYGLTPPWDDQEAAS